MDLIAMLRRFAFAETRALPVLGRGGGPLWRAFLHERRACPTRSPHDADILVLAGEIPAGWREAISALFETVALPRVAIWLRPPWPSTPPDGLPLTSDGDWRRTLLDPSAPARQPVLPDEPPSPWRGEGDHGQGGDGMMGGKPYGRPMSMTGPDPDGLMLGAVATSLGPFFPGLPSGLQIELTMQGDRIHAVDKVTNWYDEIETDTPRVSEAFRPAMKAARGETVRIAHLERTRLQSHLAWAANMLALAGLPALAERFDRAIHAPRRSAVETLFATAERTGLERIWRGVGRLSLDEVQDLGIDGPNARASGQPVDARLRSDGYAGLVFNPSTASGGDVWSRWQVRRDECLQAFRLIEEAGSARTTAAEAPRGAVRIVDGRIETPSRRHVTLLKALLPGLLWDEAVMCIASLDLDMEEAALR
jgi:hypothetical protein